MVSSMMSLLTSVVRLRIASQMHVLLLQIWMQSVLVVLCLQLSVLGMIVLHAVLIAVLAEVYTADGYTEALASL